jgi:hypothetical protein
VPAPAADGDASAPAQSQAVTDAAAFTSVPDVLVAVLCWVLGEYGHLPSCGLSLADCASRLSILAQRAGLETATRGYALDAVIKLTVGRGLPLPPAAGRLQAAFAASRHVELSQRAGEWAALAARAPSGLPRAVLPVDASSEDIAVEEEMPFLAAFVAEALSAGAKPYAPPAPEGGEAGGEAHEGPHAGGLRFDQLQCQGFVAARGMQKGARTAIDVGHLRIGLRAFHAHAVCGRRLHLVVGRRARPGDNRRPPPRFPTRHRLRLGQIRLRRNRVT